MCEGGRLKGEAHFFLIISSTSLLFASTYNEYAVSLLSCDKLFVIVPTTSFAFANLCKEFATCSAMDAFEDAFEDSI